MAEPPLGFLKGIIFLPKLQDSNGAVVAVIGYVVSSDCQQDRCQQDDHRKSHVKTKKYTHFHYWYYLIIFDTFSRPNLKQDDNL